MARPFTVIGFTIFFTLTLIFELGQKAAVVILSAAAAAFVFSLFFESVRRDFVIPTACIAAAVAVLLSFAASSVPVEASERAGQDIIMRTPGYEYYKPELQAALKAGAMVTSEVELFFEFCPCEIVAVTGSDGKTTTTTLISKMFEAAAARSFWAATSVRRCCPSWPT